VPDRPGDARHAVPATRLAADRKHRHLICVLASVDPKWIEGSEVVIGVERAAVNNLFPHFRVGYVERSQHGGGVQQMPEFNGLDLLHHLTRHGIRIPFPTHTVQLERPPRDKQQEVQTAARVLLRQQPLFRCLSDLELDSLLPRGRVVHFGRGEKLIQQGDTGDSMFILVDGQANVLVERNGSPKEVALLNSGDCFGEMSLLTGEKRSATIVAHTDCEVVEITKTVLAKSLQANPDLLDQLSKLLAKRQMETEGILAAGTPRERIEAQQNKYAATFLDKLQSFFKL